MSNRITMAQLYDFVKNLPKDEVVLDVRSEEEYNEGHVPGSLNIPVDVVAQQADKLKKFKKIYIHCGMGGRAQMAHDELVNKGINQLVCVVGSGMGDWIEAGHPIEK